MDAEETIWFVDTDSIAEFTEMEEEFDELEEEIAA